MRQSTPELDRKEAQAHAMFLSLMTCLSVPVSKLHADRTRQIFHGDFHLLATLRGMEVKHMPINMTFPQVFLELGRILHLRRPADWDGVDQIEHALGLATDFVRKLFPPGTRDVSCALLPEKHRQAGWLVYANHENGLLFLYPAADILAYARGEVLAGRTLWGHGEKPFGNNRWTLSVRIPYPRHIFRLTGETWVYEGTGSLEEIRNELRHEQAAA